MIGNVIAIIFGLVVAAIAAALILSGKILAGIGVVVLLLLALVVAVAMRI